LVIVKGEECQCPAENNADGIHKNIPCGEGKFRDPLEILGSLHIQFFISIPTRHHMCVNV